MTEEEIIFNDASYFDQEMYGYHEQPANTYMFPVEYEYEQQFEPQIEYKEDENLESDKKYPEIVQEALAIEDSSKNV